MTNWDIFISVGFAVGISTVVILWALSKFEDKFYQLADHISEGHDLVREVVKGFNYLKVSDMQQPQVIVSPIPQKQIPVSIKEKEDYVIYGESD